MIPFNDRVYPVVKAPWSVSSADPMRDPRVTVVTLSGAAGWCWRTQEASGSRCLGWGHVNSFCGKCKFSDRDDDECFQPLSQFVEWHSMLSPPWQRKGSEESLHCVHFAIWSPEVRTVTF